MGKEEMTKTHIATISVGEIFGESCLFRYSESTRGNSISEITVEASSMNCKLYYAKAAEFGRIFKNAAELIFINYRNKIAFLNKSA